jgi:hypothetical protein
VEETKPSYLGAFLKHPTNRNAMLSAAVVAVFASIPLGLSGLALVGILALGTEALAALMVPSLPSFRASVDRAQRFQARHERKEQLIADIRQLGDSRVLSTYQHMWTRVQALYQTVQQKRTSLSQPDVEKLEDMTLDYLGLCAVNLSLKQRKDHASVEVAERGMATVQAQLKRADLPGDEARQLRAALAQYEDTLQRSRRLAVRRSALEATLVALPEKLEEVYQLAITSPYSTDMGGKLEESLSRLRIAEEVAAEFSSPEYDLDAPVAASPASRSSSRFAQKAANGVKA